MSDGIIMIMIMTIIIIIIIIINAEIHDQFVMWFQYWERPERLAWDSEGAIGLEWPTPWRFGSSQEKRESSVHEYALRTYDF